MSRLTALEGLLADRLFTLHGKSPSRVRVPEARYASRLKSFFSRHVSLQGPSTLGKVTKFLQCLQCQLPSCSETYQQQRTQPKQ